MVYTWQDIERVLEEYLKDRRVLEDKIRSLETELLKKDIEINNLNLQLSLLKALYQNQPPNIAP